MSKLDISAAYWQVEVAPDDRPKTAFTTMGGLFQYCVMPFGLVNAPATYQRLMENVLRGLLWKKCFVFIDDVLVMGKDFQEHLGNLREVFERLRTANLKLKLSKCSFCEPEICYLGHILSKDGIRADPEKIRPILNLSPPRDAKELQRILGMVNYLAKFIPKFANITGILYKLLRKGEAWKWSPAHQAAFDQIKLILCNPPVLAYPNFSQPHFFLQTDASKTAVAGILSQRGSNGIDRVIGYYS
ncbi:MAG: hypothetical protein GY816_01625, partial [Cytophagales bacterium]|nr:hypothetical protein [Cytophagales bacterium]